MEPSQTVIAGKYTIVTQLGEGGFGQVYRAKNNEDEEAEDVAVKIEPKDAKDPQLEIESKVMKVRYGIYSLVVVIQFK